MMIFAILLASVFSGKAEKLGANLIDSVMKTGFHYWDTGKISSQN